jgi:ATP-dependent Lon protease
LKNCSWANEKFNLPYILDYRDLWNNRIININYRPNITEKIQDDVSAYWWKKWSKKAKEVFQKEFEKMSRMHPQMAEYSVQMNYLEWLLDLPWAAMAKDNFDLKHAQEILDRDHYGLEKIKERVVEHLAVLKLKKDMKAPILCFYGPPGVGKTSLGKSVAESLGRPYVRIALGGMRDEAEIRGHRRTYIGAMPGRIIQALKKAGKSNPVVVLDEIDKVGREGYGDPSAALLEVLDPEQNNAFVDNYLEVEYDLSQVLFIATANSLSSVHNALLDRMEIVEVTGYSTEEKIKIAQKHLVPKSISEHGISEKQMHIQDDVLEIVIEEYTRESGVRNLRQKIDKLSRQRAKQVALSETFNVTYSAEEVRRILGVSHPKEKYADNTHAGVVTGLAWTSVGGDILFIETSLTRGKGRLSLTGNLGDVMKESATLAMQYLKANPELLHLDYRIFDQWDVHLHFPEGATPKDGPSAGITILTALASAFTQRKVAPLLAMTGEITLRGKVLPVGGIKEKLLAAKRAGIKQIIMSQENQKDVADIQQEFLQGLNIHYVENMSQVLEKALMQEQVEQPKNINYVEEKPTTHAN